jgi:ATP-dependent DNA helicase 2 subunit 2
MAEAVDDLVTPRIKAVRPFKAYDGTLTLGDPKKYETALSILVERYSKTKVAAPPSASAVAGKSDNVGSSARSASGADDDVDMGGVKFSSLKNIRNYTVNDPEYPGQKRDIDAEDVSKGFVYGQTAVYISESDQNITQFETYKSFTIIGFIPFDSVSSTVELVSGAKNLTST